MTKPATLTLSRQEALKLSQEAKSLANWVTVRDFATQVYGEGKAARVEIETHEEYDDENYSYPIGAITAYDNDGNKLEPDYSLPFFGTKEWQKAANYFGNYYEDPGLVGKLNEVSRPADESWPWLLINDLPQKTASYDLTVVPVLTLPTEVTTS